MNGRITIPLGLFRDRFYLLRRRALVALRMRHEFRWGWWCCWQMSRVHQRHMLLILAAIREEQAAVEELRAEMDCELDRWLADGAAL